MFTITRMAEACMPDEILDNILARLPGKSLLRSRCVSKHWNRLISDPCFMKLRSRQMILFGYPWPLVVIDDNVPVEDKAHSMLKIPSLLEYAIVYIVGTFSGLVILVFTDMLSRGHMILYNPLTRASKTLAVMDPPSNRYLPYVFGFDTDELKVVRFEFINHPTQGRVFKCDVFHLKTSLWSTPPRYFKQDFYFWIDEGIFINGFLYWAFTFASVGILALNVSEMVISFLTLPHGRDAKMFPLLKSDYTEIRLGSLNGYLCMLTKTDTITFNVWVMTEQGVQNSWLKTLSFTFGVEGNYLNEFHPKGILGNGKILLMNSNQLVIYDTSNGSYRTSNNLASLDDFVEKSMREYIYKVLPIVYMESLVSPLDIPKKVNICVWRASLNRIPTRSNLASRGLILSSTCCPFCDDAWDEIGHCGISCPRVLPVWRKVWSWWNLPSPVVFPSFSVADVAMGRIDSFGGSRMNKVLHGVL
ncbi:F-box domain containing protein [Tanacetum coccineum]